MDGGWWQWVNCEIWHQLCWTYFWPWYSCMSHDVAADPVSDRWYCNMSHNATADFILFIFCVCRRSLNKKDLPKAMLYLPKMINFGPVTLHEGWNEIVKSKEKTHKKRGVILKIIKFSKFNCSTFVNLWHENKLFLLFW